MNIKELLEANRRIHPDTGCWLWTSRLNAQGYGVLSLPSDSGTKKYRDYLVHRLAFIEFKGELKNFALHITTCFFWHCFNPDHLYDGTHTENIADMRLVGSHSNQYGNTNKIRCKNGHPLIGENLLITSEGRRRCRTCRDEYNKNNPNKKQYNENRKLKGKM